MSGKEYDLGEHLSLENGQLETSTLKPQKRKSSKNVLELELWAKYKQEAGSVSSREALEELLDRHEGLLRKLAWKMTTAHASEGTFDDFMQVARVGAIRAYDKFDPLEADRSGACLSTYVHRKASLYLLDSLDSEAMIVCPNHMRAVRSYFMGRYDNDPIRKQKFELEHGLSNAEKIAIARKKYELLAPSFFSLHDNSDNDSSDMDIVGIACYDFGDDSCLTEDEIIAKLDFEQAKSKLSDRASQVLRLCFEDDLTMKQAADKLNITEGRVRSDIRTIREQMSRTLQDYA